MNARITTLLALLLVAACGAPSTAPEPVPPPPGALSAGPWTPAFLEPANLIADEIVIEGPPALREHFSARQDSVGTVYAAKTTEKGFLQEIKARPDAGYVEIHASLDRWQLVAFRRLVWLERPATAPVVIRALGSATFQSVDGGELRRDELLEFREDVGR